MHRIKSPRENSNDQIHGQQKHHAYEFSICSGLSIKSRMSSTRQAVIFGPNLTGCGNRFDLTPAHHVLLETGIGPSGAMIFLRRMNPVSGRQNFGIGDFAAAMGAVASNSFIVFSLAFSISFQICIAGKQPRNCPPVRRQRRISGG